MIETLPKQGYRFIAQIQSVEEEAETADAPPSQDVVATVELLCRNTVPAAGFFSPRTVWIAAEPAEVGCQTRPLGAAAPLLELNTPIVRPFGKVAAKLVCRSCTIWLLCPIVFTSNAAIVGGVVSRTVIVWAAFVELPQASVAVQVREMT